MPPYLQQAVYTPITGTCRATIRPDVAVIVGGLSASGLKPTETAMRLQRQIGALEALATEEGGTIRMVERVRATRPTNLRSRRRDEPDQEPYVVLQRFEIELNVDADIDRVLEKALQIGLDRYGSSAAIDPQTTRWQPLVVYRFEQLDLLLQSVHEECRSAAIHTWCEARRGADAGTCVDALAAPGLHLVTEQLVLRSLPVTNADGSVNAVELTWPFAGAAGLELGGDGELALSGEIWLRLAQGFQ